MLDMDFGYEPSVCEGMSETPDDTRELIRHLCTQAGMIMEDASAEAILWDGDREALDVLANQIAKAQAIIAMAKTMAGMPA